MFQEGVTWFADALFPKNCVRCGDVGEHVCQSCYSVSTSDSPKRSCTVCGTYSSIGATCMKCPSNLDGVLFSANYSDPVANGLLRRWKFSFVRGVEPDIKRIIQRAPLARVFGIGPWTVVPVPLHKRRERFRGFDQAKWIAKVVGDILGQPAANLLKRQKNTPQQARRSHESRSRDDLQGVFVSREPIDGRVILCDDVTTSGATLEAAASACREAGATSVWAYTITKG